LLGGLLEALGEHGHELFLLAQPSFEISSD